MKFEMHEVDSCDDLRNPGDYMMAERKNGTKFPIIVCPKCLRPGSCSNHTLVQEKPLTITASYLCGQASGKGKTCGWHGWVTNGFMEGD